MPINRLYYRSAQCESVLICIANLFQTTSYQPSFQVLADCPLSLHKFSSEHYVYVCVRCF